MKIRLLSLLALFIISSVSAQKSFFEALEAHGPDAKYQLHGGVYVNSEGKQVLRPQSEGFHGLVTYKVHPEEGSKVGIALLRYSEKSKDTIGLEGYNPLKDGSVKLHGYPNTSMLHDSDYRRGFVAIDNAIYHLGGVSDDKTDFKEIRSITLLEGSANSKADGKKKKKGKLWGKLKKAAVNASGLVDPMITPEYKALMKNDPEQIVRDYLKAMKVKQDAYTLTAEDNRKLASIYQAAKDHAAYVKNYNKEYWESPEGQRILRNSANVDAVHAEHLRKCRTSGCDNNAHN